MSGSKTHFISLQQLGVLGGVGELTRGTRGHGPRLHVHRPVTRVTVPAPTHGGVLLFVESRGEQLLGRRTK